MKGHVPAQSYDITNRIEHSKQHQAAAQEQT